MTIQYFDSLPSTNQYCEKQDLEQIEEGTVIAARAQTAGLGQQGNHWESQAGKNLAFSLILKPTFLPMAEQYRMTKVVSLGIADKLRREEGLQQRVHIKWPNDIYVDNNKICGILISNRVAAGKMETSIIGIGLNVNQETFSSQIPNPTSLKQLTGHTYPLDNYLEELLECLEQRYRQLRAGLWQEIDTDYLALLLRRNVRAEYLYHGEHIYATLLDVNRFGHLQLVTDDGRTLSCEMKELKFIF